MVASLSLFANGITIGVAGMPNHKAKRGNVMGWSKGAAQRNLRFLYAVDLAALEADGTVGLAFTLTVRDCPATPDVWARIRDEFFRAMEKLFGCVRLHWVVEWQRRQVPHVHGCLFFPAHRVPLTAEIVNCWCFIAKHYALSAGQTVKRLYAFGGWAQYVAKHAARGAWHYQRSGTAIPKTWRDGTGRMWGYRGNWPVPKPEKFGLDGRRGDGAYFAFRRLVRSWRIADARKSGNGRRIASARRMLKCGEKKRSEVRGLSEWVPTATAKQLLDNLLSRGYSVNLPQEKPQPAPRQQTSKSGEDGSLSLREFAYRLLRDR